MKAHYNTNDRDYYILFEGNEIERITNGETIEGEMYIVSGSEIKFARRKLHITSVKGTMELYTKNMSSKYKLKNYNDPLLLEFGDVENSIPFVLTLKASWMAVGLSKEHLKRCGKNEQWYANGCKIHFYADEGYSLFSMFRIGFEIVEARWKGEHGLT